ncbi:trypsin-like serine protease [bacterium]|jgi:serine protease Do|nr:trypsin-like serine protease [bacterium]MBT4251049.1 trypsin-like serine protease [bacterium]MBT4597954.1 trypsin-like serine protease [bacterium]MBT6753477.1 trypsin-like serine protease [bacterium]MBT7037996.1 trypsin-like serine protease [bacterium]
MSDNLIEQDPDLIIKKTDDDMIIKTEKKKIDRLKMSIIVICVFISAFVGGVSGFLASELSTEGIKSMLSKLENRKGPMKELLHSSNGIANEDLPKISVIEEESAVIDAVEKSSPAVVSVIVTKDVPKLNSYFSDPFASDPFFSPFGFKSAPKSAPETEKREVGGGTGFILSEDGYIVTNRHVVDDDKADYSVITNDGDRYDAVVLARDTVLDIAVIKIEARNLATIKLGDSDKLKAGQTVIAIGNSLGEFRNTVSKGIISGLKRSISAGNGRGQSEILEEVIQTDAAINPGNSGGPIVDLKGNVVGVNVAMAQGAENIGFAIPINNVKRIYQSVKSTGRIIRPYIGVRYMVINKDLQEVNSLKFDYGAIIVRGDRPSDLAIVPGSPADKAGLSEGDIILEINGEKIKKETDLSRMVRNKNVGDEITLNVWSKNSEKIIKVKLEEAK